MNSYNLITRAAQDNAAATPSTQAETMEAWGYVRCELERIVQAATGLQGSTVRVLLDNQLRQRPSNTILTALEFSGILATYAGMQYTIRKGFGWFNAEGEFTVSAQRMSEGFVGRNLIPGLTTPESNGSVARNLVQLLNL